MALDSFSDALSFIDSFYPDAPEKLNEQKARAFDKIAALFYKRNFGSVSKSETELLMFSIFMDILIDNYHDENNVLDYNECSDYNIAKLLGIQQSKVRNLKLNKQARYPVKFDWKRSLCSIKDNIRYEELDNKIVIPTNDPNLYNEIRRFIETKGGYIKIGFSNNCIVIRPEYFFLLICETCEPDDKTAILTKLKELNEQQSMDNTETPKDKSKYAVELSKELFDFILETGVCTAPLTAVLKGVKLVWNIISANM